MTRSSVNASSVDGSQRVLDDEELELAHEIIAKYPNPRSAMLPLLFLVQSVEGYVTEPGMREVAGLLGLTPAQVLAVASFYTMLKKRPQGDYLVSVCRNISCTHRGARKIIAAFEERLGVPVDGTTGDGRFTLETAECLATCDGAPSIQINYEDFYDLTLDKVDGLVGSLERGEEVRSARGAAVRTATEIAREVALTGMSLPDAPENLRTVAGEVPAADMAPSHRPAEHGGSDRVAPVHQPAERHDPTERPGAPGYEPDLEPSEGSSTEEMKDSGGRPPQEEENR